MQGSRTRRLRRIVAVAAAVVCTSVVPARADCPAPSITVPRSVVAGTDLVVRGEFFAAQCNDTSTGCVGPRRSPPMRGMSVAMQDDFAVVVGATVDADDSFEFAVALAVPSDAAPGTYSVVVAGEEQNPGLLATAEVRVRAP